MKQYNIAVIAGDGIGPEVTREAMRVLSAVSDIDGGISFRFTELPWGTDYYLQTGQMMPDDGIAQLRAFDAIMLGAVGDPRVPDHVTLWGLLLRIRQELQLYVNLRPVKLLAGVMGPLAGRLPEEIDMVVLRENSEGEYAGVGGFLYPGGEREVALQTAVYSRVGVERIVRYAFELGRSLGKSVTSVSKGNACNYSGVLWDRVFGEIAREYKDVQTQSLLVDAAAMFFVRDPRRFQVVVTGNLYGDILTDLGAAISGGMGLAASANLDPTGQSPSLFEPVHGSAPDIAGQGIANPLAAIWSSSLLLNHLGHRAWGERVLAAIAQVTLKGDCLPRDLGGSASTVEVGSRVSATLAKAAG